MGKEPEENIDDREISINEEELGLDDKETQDEKSEKEESSASEKKEEEQKDESSEEESSSADSLKTEKDESKEEKSEDENTRFDKHPRFIQLKQERDEALEQAKALKELQETVGDTDISELKKIREASNLLKKYPELAKKVQDVIDNHTFENEETANKFNQLLERQEELETKILVDKFATEINGMISKTDGIKKEEEPLFREILSLRIAQLKIKDENDMPKIKSVFDKTLKDIESFRRINLASHIETKKSEKSVPASSKLGEKVIPKKKESAEFEDVRDEITEGLKSMRSDTEK